MSDWTDLKTYINVSGDSQDTFIQQCFDVATSLVDTLLTGGVVGGSQTFRPVPTTVSDLWVLMAGKNLYKRKDASNGGSAPYASPDGGVVPGLQLDPLTTVRPLAARFICPF